MKKAFKMKLYDGMLEEYQKRHQQVFPELLLEFKKAGLTDYSIWLDEESNFLFAYLNVGNVEIWNQISETEACRKWWKFMAPIMETNLDDSPKSKDLILAYDYEKV
ncbi:MAG: L-rhamnose mutarotase [Lactovum sp.]